MPSAREQLTVVAIIGSIAVTGAYVLYANWGRITLGTSVDRDAYWARVDKRAAEYNHERQSKSETLIDQCLRRRGSAHTNESGYFSGCVIPPPKQQ